MFQLTKTNTKMHFSKGKKKTINSKTKIDTPYSDN